MDQNPPITTYKHDLWTLAQSIDVSWDICYDNHSSEKLKYIVLNFVKLN